MSFVSAKAECRRRLRAALQKMSPEARDQQSRDICSHLATLPEIVAARCIMLYAALPLEPDLDALITRWTEAGKWVVLPRIEGTAPGHIEPVRVRGQSDLVAGYQGIREPGESCQRTPLAVIELVLVPGLGFAPETGARIGKGRGHYDTFLAACETARQGQPLRAIGVAFQEQCLPPDELPMEPHDRLLSGVVTAGGLIRPSR